MLHLSFEDLHLPLADTEPWQWGVLALVALLPTAVRMWPRKRPGVTQPQGQQWRGTQYLERIFTLSDPIVNGSGRLRVDDDSIWQVLGPDTPSGAQVMVIGVDGTLLLVEPFPQTE
ncbi:MAG: NfeD family protein [Magnetococcales bacterium]|nr:NfeD family protein [Magnetococcales bacterium]